MSLRLHRARLAQVFVFAAADVVQPRTDELPGNLHRARIAVGEHRVESVARQSAAATGVVGLTRMQLGFPLGYLDQTDTTQLFDFKRDDHPFVPIYMFVDRKGTVRFQYAGKEDFFKNEEKNTRILVESLLKQK